MTRVYRMTVHSLEHDESYMAGKLHVPGMVKTADELLSLLDEAEYIDCPATLEDRQRLTIMFSGKDGFDVMQEEAIILEGDFLTYY